MPAPEPVVEADTGQAVIQADVAKETPVQVPEVSQPAPDVARQGVDDEIPQPDLDSIPDGDRLDAGTFLGGDSIGTDTGQEQQTGATPPPADVEH